MISSGVGLSWLRFRSRLWTSSLLIRGLRPFRLFRLAEESPLLRWKGDATRDGMPRGEVTRDGKTRGEPARIGMGSPGDPARDAGEPVRPNIGEATRLEKGDSNGDALRLRGSGIGRSSIDSIERRRDDMEALRFRGDIGGGVDVRTGFKFSSVGTLSSGSTIPSSAASPDRETSDWLNDRLDGSMSSCADPDMKESSTICTSSFTCTENGSVDANVNLERNIRCVIAHTFVIVIALDLVRLLDAKVEFRNRADFDGAGDELASPRG